ncbi:MAG: hypothetical protein A2157_11745 [Deltaproteobacteria bacterium RBG_16_47_11]|nr:MAG: hypothetical protein A2157_11745 [Deltaproteobacteria bacterium RBG_16_47_11]
MALHIVNNQPRARAGSQVALPFFCMVESKIINLQKMMPVNIRRESRQSRGHWVVQDTFIFILS